MASLVSRPITVRGDTYMVSELDGKTMAAVRKMLKSGSEETDLFITLNALVDPKPKNMAAVEAMPNIVVNAIAKKALALTQADDPDEPETVKKEGETSGSDAKKD
jgi:hypothetical protein